MRSLLIIVLACICGSFATGQNSQSDDTTSEKAGGSRPNVVVLDSAVKILAPEAPEPLHRAAEDLADDLKKVLGKRPEVLNRTQNVRDTILIGKQSEIAEELRTPGLTKPESFSISVNRISKKPEARVVVLSGADIRGTIYAVYEFSQKYLGIDPLYYWTDQQPAHRASIEIPASLNQSYAPPVFKYRGFFINDEDLLTGWAPGEAKDKTGISLEVWDKIYETILRLKGNMVARGRGFSLMIRR